MGALPAGRHNLRKLPFFAASMRLIGIVLMVGSICLTILSVTVGMAFCSPRQPLHSDGFCAVALMPLVFVFEAHSDCGVKFGPFDGIARNFYDYRPQWFLPPIAFERSNSIYGRGWTVEFWLPTPLIFWAGWLIFHPFQMGSPKQLRGFPATPQLKND